MQELLARVRNVIRLQEGLADRLSQKVTELELQATADANRIGASLRPSAAGSEAWRVKPWRQPRPPQQL